MQLPTPTPVSTILVAPSFKSSPQVNCSFVCVVVDLKLGACMGFQCKPFGKLDVVCNWHCNCM